MEQFPKISEASKEDQENIDQVLGEDQGSEVSLWHINVRLDAPSSEDRVKVLHSEKFKNFVSNYVIGKGRGLKASLWDMNNRLTYVPEEIKSEVINSEQVKQFAIEYILNESAPSSRSTAKTLLGFVPEEIRSEVANSPEIQKVFPGLEK